MFLQLTVTQNGEVNNNFFSNKKSKDIDKIVTIKVRIFIIRQ